MRILGFAGSNSSKSINRRFVRYVVTHFNDATVEILDLNDFEMPIYSMDREQNNGIPESAVKFALKIDNCDLIIISLAEHNGAYSAAFKNILDWISRMEDRSVCNGKPMLLLSTSPGSRGGASVLEMAKTRFPRNGARILESFSLPSFNDNFDDRSGITNIELKNALLKKIGTIKETLSDIDN